MPQKKKLEDLPSTSVTDWLSQFGTGAVGPGDYRQGVVGSRVLETLRGLLGDAISVPKRAMESSESMRQGGDLDPGPILEAAMLPIGGTALSAPKGALGAGPAFKSQESFESYVAKIKEKYGTTDVEKIIDSVLAETRAAQPSKLTDVKQGITSSQPGAGFSPLPKKVDPETAKLLAEVDEIMSLGPKGAPPPPELAQVVKAITESSGPKFFGKSISPELVKYLDEHGWQPAKPAGIPWYTQPTEKTQPASKVRGKSSDERNRKSLPAEKALEPLDWRGLTSEHATEFSRNIPVHAEQLGFNPHFPLYKGRASNRPTTNKELADPSKKDYERALFFGEDPAVARKYGRLSQYVARAENPAQIDWKAVSSSKSYGGDVMDQIVEAGRRRGHDLVLVKGLRDVGGKQNQVLVLDPSIVRLPHAVFDPKRIKENNLLGGIAGGGLVGLAALESERRQ